ncbi:hypothetical protein A3860_21055 [Niastella vici]|uniref:RDD domain-containing protein n=1 Tax=Niastella vici TaxID=1703345 RepID=A0A1V9G1D9_9BACT|nr:RDD family protein [Niastella vici]OQP64459.1 hypothetical protein A3860_21055 [Niastella vici]
MENTNPDLLQEFELTVDLTPVSPGLRFVNYLIDVIAFYALAFIIGMLYALIATPNSYSGEVSDERGSLQILLLLAWILIMVAYYTLFEFFAKGRTLGKMATGTVAVREDGSNLTFKDALLRTLCRFIPFEPFSAFGYRPWHDSMTRTFVIKKRKKV